MIAWFSRLLLRRKGPISDRVVSTHILAREYTFYPSPLLSPPFPSLSLLPLYPGCSDFRSFGARNILECCVVPWSCGSIFMRRE